MFQYIMSMMRAVIAIASIIKPATSETRIAMIPVMIEAANKIGPIQRSVVVRL